MPIGHTTWLRRRIGSRAVVATLSSAMVLAGCGDSPAGPGPAGVEFSSSQVTLDGVGEAAISIRNRSAAAVGPIEFDVGPVRNSGGAAVPGAGLVLSPGTIPTLPPSMDREVTLSLNAGDGLQPGGYSSSVRAIDGQGFHLATLEVRFTWACASDQPLAHSLEVVAPPSSLRQGEVVRLNLDARDSDGAALENPCLVWDLDTADAGFLSPEGRFVAYTPGPRTLTLRSGIAEVQFDITVTPRGVDGGRFTEVGAGRWTIQHTSDLWLHGDVAYTGTWGARNSPEGVRFGNSLHAWDISDPADPVHTHTVEVNARTVNDVKIRDDGTLAVMTHEISNDGLNGVTLLNLSNPHQPTTITRFMDGLQAGIHNVWIEGDYVYLVVNGVGNGLRVLDVSDPSNPRIVSVFYGGSSFLHDVYVRDGLAFLSHWNAGLIILDVGNGMLGGSPENPVEVGRTTTTGGRTHNAWYWPETGYVFVGEENFDQPGVMHVIDASDLTNPREVATFAIPGFTPHNFWLDEARGILYMAWYGRGLRALDVTGELVGSLERQGREIAAIVYEDSAPEATCRGPVGRTCTWAPQLHRGHVFVSDMNSGLRVLRPEF